MQLKNSLLSLFVACAFSRGAYGSPSPIVTVCRPCPTVPFITARGLVDSDPTPTFNPGGPIITGTPIPTEVNHYKRDAVTVTKDCLCPI
ncbi:hypothetical protein BD410DRAFT_790434, partial [Rickenella mellea]